MTRLDHARGQIPTDYNYGYFPGITSDLKGFLIFRR